MFVCLSSSQYVCSLMFALSHFLPRQESADTKMHYCALHYITYCITVKSRHTPKCTAILLVHYSEQCYTTCYYILLHITVNTHQNALLYYYCITVKSAHTPKYALYLTFYWMYCPISNCITLHGTIIECQHCSPFSRCAVFELSCVKLSWL